MQALLTPLIGRFARLAPEVRVSVRYLSRQEYLDQLREGRVHFAPDIVAGSDYLCVLPQRAAQSVSRRPSLDA